MRTLGIDNSCAINKKLYTGSKAKDTVVKEVDTVLVACFSSHASGCSTLG